MPPDYFHTVIQILDRGLKTNSYKFALLRAFSDYGAQRQSADHISFEWLAERFISYYWPLATTFRVRQATDPTRDPVIMRFIRQEAAALSLTPNCRLEEFKRQHADRYNALLLRCCGPGGCFDEVVPRFHNIRSNGTVVSKLYEPLGNTLQLHDGASQFLIIHHRTLNLLAVGAWVQFTEQFTFAPRLYEKIAGIPPERKQERYRSFLVSLQGSKCFYCGVASERLHIDHVIPWSFTLEDRIWNLVLACRLCNCAKSDRTPDDQMLAQLTTRNNDLLDAIRVDSQPLRIARVKRDLQGFNQDSLRLHISALVENCRADGFGVWSRKSGAKH